MSGTDTIFAGSIPAIYDSYMVPLLFRPYAQAVAERVRALRPHRILETASGTGVLTEALHHALPQADIVATDLNQPMLDHAAAQLPSSRVTWQQADAHALPFPDGAFDAVICQFGVMFFDKRRAYREVRRVLKPRGHFIFNVWDKLEYNDFTALVTAAAVDIFPDDPPLFFARIPHGYHDKDAIVADVRDAGFANVTLETVTLRSVAPSCRDAAVGLCQGTPLRSEIEARDPSKLAEVTDAGAARIAARFGSGPVDGMIQAHVVIAS